MATLIEGGDPRVKWPLLTTSELSPQKFPPYSEGYTMPSLPMNTNMALSDLLQKRIDAVHKIRQSCIKANAADRASELAAQRERSRMFKAKSSMSDEVSDLPQSEQNDDRVQWTAQRWELYEKSRTRAGSRSGYKGHFDLAHSTYVKEISRLSVDKEKYSKSTGAKNEPFSVRLAQEDIDKLSKSLQEASERRLKKRRKDASGGDFITEKNRQFNMKLDREFGRDE